MRRSPTVRERFTDGLYVRSSSTVRDAPERIPTGSAWEGYVMLKRLRYRAADLLRPAEQPVPERSKPAPPPADPLAAERERLENHHRAFPARTVRIGEHIAALLEKSGVTGGRILEIGGRANPYTEFFDGFEYVCLDLVETGHGVIRGDITDCPEIADASFDAVISVDVFEHIKEPWLAAPEIVRILRPGGFTYHSTLFSWRYHPCPVDFWRYTPDALSFLFKDLEPLEADFDTVERRRNIIGRDGNRVTPDAFGGWRENWRVFYAGVKPEN